MPSKKGYSKRSSSGSGTKHKIVFEIPFGPFPTASVASVAKKRIKTKTPKIVFSSVKKSSRGYSFNGKLTFVKAINAPRSAIKQALQAKTPGAKVTVIGA